MLRCRYDDFSIRALRVGYGIGGVAEGGANRENSATALQIALPPGGTGGEGRVSGRHPLGPLGGGNVRRLRPGRELRDETGSRGARR